MENGYPQSSPPEQSSKRLSWLTNLGSQGQEDNDLLDLGQIFSILGRRAWIILGITGLAAAAGFAKGRVSPVYNSQFQIVTKPMTVETQVVSSLSQSLNNQPPEGVGPGGKGIDETRLRLLLSPEILDPVVDRLRKQYPDINYYSLVTGLQVKPIADTSIFNVLYQDSNSKRVKAVMEALEERYVQYALEERRSDAKKGIEFIDEQLPELRNKVQEQQLELERFRKQYNFFDPESQNRELAEQMTSFRRDRLANEVDLKRVQQQYQELQQSITKSPQDRLAALALKQSPTYQTLLNQFITIESQIAEQQAIFVPGSENLKILQDQRRKLLDLLEREAERAQAEVGSQVKDLTARQQALRQTEAGLNNRVQQLSVVARRYTDIQRELQIATENLNQFLAKRSTLDIDVGQKLPPWKVVTPSGEPILTSVRNNFLLGSLLGVVGGVVAALLVDRLSNVYYNSNEIRKASKLPVLGIIPFNQELPRIEQMGAVQLGNLFQPNANLSLWSGKVRKFGTLPFLEAFRLLQTNLRLLNADRPVRSLVISSPNPQDGKSTAATYLAQAAASMGQKVLLVDAELRRPQLHYRLGLPNSQGLTDLLTSSADASEFIQTTTIHANIHVLTAGSIPPDPVALLSSQRMQSLMEQFRAQYDLVIYDTPPLAGLSDAHLIAAKTDGFLLVTRICKTNRDAFQYVLDQLRLMPTPVLGLVINESRKVPSTPYTSYYFEPAHQPKFLPQGTKKSSGQPIER
ncbi:MAG: polysaccharide biosynthesis tyrosine autokinase [Synechococcales bacterium]|nr:polysaccharide biosynthesis tyrosine autokinase [Synechococcales bacterium]